MFTVILESIVAHAPFTGMSTNLAYEATKTIQLPFAPFPGLALIMSDRGRDMGWDYQASRVVWDATTSSFICHEETQLEPVPDVHQVAADLREAGWEVVAIPQVQS